VARTQTAQPPVVNGVVDVPRHAFRRATPADALDAAVATHLSGARVDMGVLAQQLGISRATLHRWVGSRELLLERVLAQRAELFIEVACSESKGTGEARVLDALRRLLDGARLADPARKFVMREPHLALRILTSEQGVVHRMIVQGLTELARETLTPKQVTALEPRIDSAVQVGSLLLYVPITVGEEPRVERTVRILRQLLID